MVGCGFWKGRCTSWYLHETGGKTLPMGALADGQFLGRTGSTAMGVAGISHSSSSITFTQSAVGQLVVGGLGNQGQVALGAHLDQDDWLIKRDVDGASTYSEAGALLALQRDVTNVTSEDGNFLECQNAAGTALGSINADGGATLTGLCRFGSLENNLWTFEVDTPRSLFASVTVASAGSYEHAALYYWSVSGTNFFAGIPDGAAQRSESMYSIGHMPGGGNYEWVKDLNVTAAGLVGIGQTAPTARLGVKGTTDDGTTNIFLGVDSADASMFAVNTNGDMTLAGALNHDGSTAGFYATAPITQPAKASYNNWESTADVADALAALGLVDAGGGADVPSRQLKSSGTLGGAVTSFDITSLDLNTDGRYILELRLEHVGGAIGDANLGIFFEADYTATNYDSVMMWCDGGAVAGSSTNDTNWGYLEDGAQVTATIELHRDIKGNLVANVWAAGFEGASNLQDARGHIRTQGVETNLTSIRILSSVASALAAGSTWKVWKVAG